MRRYTLFLLIVAAGVAGWTSAASACGGFFCQNSPVDQVGERIVFSTNADGTITSLIEIQYFGEADDFSWILPIPEAIGADALAVPDGGQDVFTELHQLTDVQFIAPEPSDCVREDQEVMATADAAEADDGGVEIFGSGEVGPFGFDIIGAEDPNALVTWLLDNDYRVTPDMEPLINTYVDDQFAFVAMRLLDGENSDSIEPIEITYPGDKPMIPIKLTAVAAQPNMPIWVWFFAEARTVPTNYDEMTIATEEIGFNSFGGNDYTFLVQQRANALGGQAFITEYAGPSADVGFAHPWLREKAEVHPYFTRMATWIDPEEMTLDPIFDIDETLDDVSNVRDATGLDGLYSCDRQQQGGGFLGGLFGGGSDAIDPFDGTAQVVAFTPETDVEPRDLAPVDDDEEPIDSAASDDVGESSGTSTSVVAAFVLGVILAGGAAFLFSRRSTS